MTDLQRRPQRKRTAARNDMGQAKRDRASEFMRGIGQQIRAELIANRITDAQTDQLVAAGILVEMDPADAEKLKVLL